MNPALDLPERFNASEYFVDRRLADGEGGRIAFECGDEQVTYAEVAERVNRFGNALRQSLGARMEERVPLLLLDGPEFAYCFFGAIKAGAVPVPLNTLLRPADYEFLLNDSRARVVVVSDSLLPLIEEIPRERLPYLEHIVVAGEARAPASHSLSQVLEAHSPTLAPAPTHRDDVAFWLYSSGSTGRPKGCVHLQHDMVVTSELYAKDILKATRDDRFFSVAKLFFAYGLGNGLYFPFALGATSILLPSPPTPKNVFSIIERYRPTLFFSVPSNFAALLDYRREGRDFDLSTVRHGISAGEALPAPIFERFRIRFGVEILDAIGSTEALHMFIANRPGAARAGSSGQIIPGCEARLLDEAGEAVPAGEIGSLWIRSDAVCSGYWNQHEKTKETFEGQWLRTGDKYRQDEDGYFWYAGRSDDMLKVSGVWVSPAEIECVLVDHPAVREAAVVGRRDKDDLVKPAAWIVLRDGRQGDDALALDLQEFVVSRLAVYKRPRWIEFVTELPKTATGKIQRFKLRESSGTPSKI